MIFLFDLKQCVAFTRKLSLDQRARVWQEVYAPITCFHLPVDHYRAVALCPQLCEDWLHGHLTLGRTLVSKKAVNVSSDLEGFYLGPMRSTIAGKVATGAC